MLINQIIVVLIYFFLKKGSGISPKVLPPVWFQQDQTKPV